MQLVNDAITWLAGEIPQQRLTCSPAVARQLFFNGVERPNLASRRRIRRLIGPPAENEAEAGLSDARISHQNYLRVHIVNAARRFGGLPFAQKNVEIEFIDVKPRARDGKARERWMKGQTTKAVASVPLDYRDDIPGFGVPDSYRVV